MFPSEKGQVLSPRSIFRDDVRGATAVEYAMIAPVFITMVLGLVEFSLYVFNRNYVKHVLYETARNISTGEIQSADSPPAAFKEAYCSHSGALLSCERLLFDVRAYDNLEDVEFTPVKFSSSGAPTNFKFEPGKSEQISVMRVALPYKFITPFMQETFLGEDNHAIVVGYSIAKIEPFGCLKSCG
jgi:Flp pilus assembly protein TadG